MSRKSKYYFLSFIKHDFKSSITVFFVALPLSLGVALASDVPLISGLIAAVVGGLIVSAVSGSHMSVSGAAAGLTAICAQAVTDLGSLQFFFWAVSIAGIFQILLGLFKIGGFTHLVPSAVIKGMLSAIGILLISKQIPTILGYNKPDFWNDTLFNLLTLNHIFGTLQSFALSISPGIILISAFTYFLFWVLEKYFQRITRIFPTTFLVVTLASGFAWILYIFFPSPLQIDASHFVSIPKDTIQDFKLNLFDAQIFNSNIWRSAVIIAFVASLETLLSLEAVDKMDPHHHISPQNRELFAQGIGNFFSGLLGGLPVTSVIVRSSANIQAGARTKTSAFMHGVWILLAITLAIPIINKIPYAILGVILIRTGYKLANPKMIVALAKQGREQLLPFVFTVGSILFTDLLIGVVIGFVYSIFFIIKHTYRAGYTYQVNQVGHNPHYVIDLANNVCFLNKKKIMELLDQIPEYAVVEINGEDSVYIDYDVLEVIEEYKQKAHMRHIELSLSGISKVSVLRHH
jgi:MFS superfamily sulfate permease-like transporter